MNYPDLNPVAFSFGPIFFIDQISIRWYGLCYVFAFLTCFTLGWWRIRKTQVIEFKQWHDVVIFGIIGTIIGGRLGYVVFYSWDTFVSDPLALFRIWEGGMSFHGGLIGVVTALFVWCRINSVPWLKLLDFVAVLAPLGVGIGRLGNFINTELPGRVTESFLGVHYPCHAVQQLTINCVGEYEEVTRHISSLYQAFTTGVIVFGIVWLYSAKPRTKGQVSGMFALLYGLGRFTTEFFREPDYFLGFVIGDWLTMGQLLSLPLILLGALLLTPAINRRLNM